jgi:hypothetical protein
MSETPNDRLLALEGEATLLRNEIASYLSMAQQASLSLTLFGKRLGRLEERIDSTRAELGGEYCDRAEGNMHPPTSDGPPILPDRLS